MDYGIQCTVGDSEQGQVVPKWVKEKMKDGHTIVEKAFKATLVKSFSIKRRNWGHLQEMGQRRACLRWDILEHT